MSGTARRKANWMRFVRNWMRTGKPTASNGDWPWWSDVRWHVDGLVPSPEGLRETLDRCKLRPDTQQEILETLQEMEWEAVARAAKHR